ncbi:MAG: glycosyltransferase family 2 protein [Thermomicrobiales bacterium]
MGMKNIAVVVLTWNNSRLTLDCLQSLAEQTTPHVVYVVDNASTDETPAAVAAQFPSARVIVNAENLGFAAGNNVGLSAAFADGADAVLVLNNDTTLDPAAFTHLVTATRMHPQAGILSPVILFAQPPHHVWFAGATTNAWTGRSYHLDYNAPYGAVVRDIREIERTTGCAVLITRACYERVGGFDASLFMYYEDIDYSLRARDAGFSILLVPSAVIYHHISASSQGTKPPNAVYYGIRNGIQTMDRLRPLPAPAMAIRRLIMVLTMLIYITRPPQAIARVRDLMDGYRDARLQRRGVRGASPTDAP